MDVDNTTNEQPKINLNNAEKLQFSEHSSFNFPMAICWLAAIISILATLFFWWMNKDAAAAVADKKSQKDAVVSEMVSPTYVDAEKKASDFKSSVNALSEAAQNRFSMVTFLSTFYTKVTNDVQISSLSVTQDGSLSITGTTKSYRSVADLLVALGSWNELSNIQLGSVSVGNTGVSFSISAKIVKANAPKTNTVSLNTKKGNDNA